MKAKLLGGVPALGSSFSLHHLQPLLTRILLHAIVIFSCQLRGNRNENLLLFVRKAAQAFPSIFSSFRKNRIDDKTIFTEHFHCAFVKIVRAKKVCNFFASYPQHNIWPVRFCLPIIPIFRISNLSFFLVLKVFSHFHFLTLSHWWAILDSSDDVANSSIFQMVNEFLLLHLRSRQMW